MKSIMNFSRGLKRALQLSLGTALGIQFVVVTPACQSKTPVGLKAPAVTEFTTPRQYEIKPEQLPKPNETESAMRPSRIVTQPETATFNLPKGVKVTVFAGGD